ncbi:MAG: CHASE domain-containing protein [Pseudomonadota bacterium]
MKLSWPEIRAFRTLPKPKWRLEAVLGQAAGWRQRALEAAGPWWGRAHAQLSRLRGIAWPDRRLLPKAVVLCLGVGISASGFFTVQHLYQTQAQTEFEGPANQYATAVSKALDRYLEAIKSVGAFFAASNEVDRWEFFEFARDALPRYPGIQAIEWIPRVPGDARAEFERQARDDGLFGFRFTQLDGLGYRVAAAPRKEHFPVYFVEPFEGNDRDLGWDLAALPSQMEALNRSRDSGRMVTAGGEGLGLAGHQPELVVVQPVYQTGEVPQSLELRQEQLLGYARGVFRLGDLVEASLAGLSAARNLDIYLFDEAAPPGERLVHFQPSPLSRGARSPLTLEEMRQGLFSETRYMVAGQPWSIFVKPIPNQLENNSDLVAWGVFIIGLLLTLLLIQYLASAHNRTQVIEQAVLARTAELSEANLALEQEVQERRRVEDELRSAKERAEVANRAKSDFLAMMGHELRTPLNSVIGFAEVLTGEALGPLGDPRYREYAGDIQRSGQDLLGIINDILQLTKIETNQFELREEPLRLPTLIEKVLASLEDRLRDTDLTIKVDADENLPQLHADREAVKQMIANLLSNAIKFTPAGGHVDVSIAMEQEGNMALQVRDSGIGIAKENLGRVLQPFTQVDQSLSRQYEGAGLGLPLTSKLAELHGGWIEIESVLGQGTTIRVIFPKTRTLEASPSSVVA